MTVLKNWSLGKRPRPIRIPGLPAGFTLVELLVSCLLASMVLVGVLVLVAGSSRTARIHTESVQMDESARLAMELLRTELMISGYRGAAFHSQHINFSALVSLEPECGLMRWGETSSYALLGITPGELDASGCVDSGGHVPGTDSLLIWGASTEFVTADRIKEGKTYLVTDAWGGYVTVSAHPQEFEPEPRHQINEYGPRLYFLRPWALLDHERYKGKAAVDAGIPTLMRKRLSGQRMVTEPLVPYIEVLHLEFSTDPVWYQQPDGGKFSPVEDVKGWDKVSAVKISLLVRSESAVHPISRFQSYKIGSRAYRFGDTYARKVYSHSVGLRNAGAPETL